MVALVTPNRRAIEAEIFLGLSLKWEHQMTQIAYKVGQRLRVGKFRKHAKRGGACARSRVCAHPDRYSLYCKGPSQQNLFNRRAVARAAIGALRRRCYHSPIVSRNAFVKKNNLLGSRIQPRWVVLSRGQVVLWGGR